jgi:hypothetical protein
MGPTPTRPSVALGETSITMKIRGKHVLGLAGLLAVAVCAPTATEAQNKGNADAQRLRGPKD